MTLAQKIDDILHGRLVCDDKLQAIGVVVAAELARANSDASEIKASFKMQCGVGSVVRNKSVYWFAYDGNGERISTQFSDDACGQKKAEFVAAAINAYEKDKALIKQLVEALRRADHTLSAHGKIDAQTPLHTFIRAAVNVFEASK